MTVYFDAKLSPKLSILIPTWKRYPGLLRHLLYFQYLVNSNGSFRANDFFLSHEVEVIIADGTPSGFDNIGYEQCRQALDLLSKSISIAYHYLPDLDYITRINFLANSASSPYVIVCGDDDFVIPDNLFDAVDFLDSHHDFVAVAGRQFDILGFNSSRSLRITQQARMLFDFDVVLPSLYARFAQYQAFNSMGISAVFYSVQRSFNLRDFTQKILSSGHNFYYGGLEFLHQLVTCSNGFISFPAWPMMLRDMTYLSYLVEKERVAPVTDPYPYQGLAAICFAENFLNSIDGGFFGKHFSSREYLDGILASQESVLNSFQRLALKAERAGSSFAADHLIDSSVICSATRAWFDTWLLRYGIKNKEALGLGSFHVRAWIKLVNGWRRVYEFYTSHWSNLFEKSF